MRKEIFKRSLINLKSIKWSSSLLVSVIIMCLILIYQAISIFLVHDSLALLILIFSFVGITSSVFAVIFIISIVRLQKMTLGL